MSKRTRSPLGALIFGTIAALLCSPALADTLPTRIHVNGVELHYIERGRGEPLILLHGGQADYRSWGPQLEAFSRDYRVISYSRRYNYPNDNPLTSTYRAAYSDADDLAALIRHLDLPQVHLVGTSAGALAALVLATKHPQLIRSMALAEPPVHRWAKDDPQGEPLYTEFMTKIWGPAGTRFKAGDDEGAMRILVDGFAAAGRFDGLPAEARAVAMQNSRFFKAATASSDPFPALPKEEVSRLDMPILILEGEHTIPLHKFVNDELARLLPKAQRAIIPRAGHGAARENPQAFNDVVAAFLKRHSGVEQGTTAAAPEKISAEDAFAQLTRMVGTWRRGDKPESPLRIRFYLTARGTVLVESWEAGDKPHSLTLYHRDGEALLATHYCPQGNQPRLALASRDTSGLHFVFRDATDLERGKESHQHDLWFDLSDPDRPVRGETYSGKDGPGAPERMPLVRDGET